MGDVVDMQGNTLRESVTQEPMRDRDRVLMQPHSDVFSRLEQFALTANCESHLIEYFRDKERLNSYVTGCLRRFAEADYGTLTETDVKENLDNMQTGLMMIGVYPFDENPKPGNADLRTYLILDAGHQTLTMLMPEDY